MRGKPTPLLALGLYLTGLALAFGVRTFVRWRRTGDSGLRTDVGAVGSIGWWAKVLLPVVRREPMAPAALAGG